MISSGRKSVFTSSVIDVCFVTNLLDFDSNRIQASIGTKTVRKHLFGDQATSSRSALNVLSHFDSAYYLSHDDEFNETPHSPYRWSENNLRHQCAARGRLFLTVWIEKR